MLNTSGGHMAGNRNSTPEANAPSSLRPLSSRTLGSSHALRGSADMSILAGPATASRIRPSSDVYTHRGGDLDPQDKIAQQWIADIDQIETTLEEMAAATLDQDFKDEINAIEQWFRVLSEAERTAALYALLQQTTQVQVRFFIQILQQMGKNHPMSGVLSPASFEKDPMSNRLTDAMSKLNSESARNSLCRPRAPSASAKRHSGLDATTINAMFPDAAAAIASEKAKFTQQTGNPPSSNRNSLAVDIRTSLASPSVISHQPHDLSDKMEQNVTSPWRPSGGEASTSTQPKSVVSQPAMGQFFQPPLSAGLRAPQGPMTAHSVIQSTTLTLDKPTADMPLLSPYGPGNWASMVNTPMASSFGANVAATQADMIANAQAMRLAALSTVNNRFALDDVRKYRRARSNDGSSSQATGLSGQSGVAGQSGVGLPGMAGANIVMINEHGQLVGRDQMMAIQAQQLAFSQRSSSPSIAIQQGFPHLQIAPQLHSHHPGYLTTYDLVNGSPASAMGINQLSVGSGAYEGYLSDHSDIVRGRSPKGRRASSRPPEEPTDLSLLQDIPTWLRSQRLHKYTDNLKDMKWTDLVELDDKGLEDRGVNALGARRKMLKVFEQKERLLTAECRSSSRRQTRCVMGERAARSDGGNMGSAVGEEGDQQLGNPQAVDPLFGH